MTSQTVYRAVCFGRPIGPWRSDIRLARRDLMEEGLGDYSEYGRAFYIMVPGDIETACRSQVMNAA